MATRTTVRTATIATLKAATAVAALAEERVYDERHADYPGTAPHPAVIVYTPRTASTPRDASEIRWQEEDEMIVQCLLKRSAGETDDALSARADTLERATRSALITSQAWRDLCDVERVTRVDVERVIGDQNDAHRMSVTLTLRLQRPDLFEQTDSPVTLDEIMVYLHPKDEATGEIPDDPTTSQLIT